MAIRNIRMMGDKVLEKTCRPVETVTPPVVRVPGPYRILESHK